MVEASDPIVRSTLQASVLAGISNLVAQYIASSRDGTPFTFDTTRFFQFILYAFMISPGNFIWQRWLETKFPAYDRKLHGEKKEEYIDDYVTGQTTKKIGGGEAAAAGGGQKQAVKKVPNELGKREQSQNLNLRNTFIKFALDSTVGTCINTVLFIVGFALIRGSEKDYIQDDVAEQFWPMFLANCKLWPLVNIISFTLVPLEHRMLFSQMINLVWGVYLSLIADGTQKF